MGLTLSFLPSFSVSCSLHDFGSSAVVSFGGGSPHDCAKAIALVATNGGDIKDYEGVDKSEKPMLPLVAINTTAGTASEMTRFCIVSRNASRIERGASALTD